MQVIHCWYCSCISSIHLRALQGDAEAGAADVATNKPSPQLRFPPTLPLIFTPAAVGQRWQQPDQWWPAALVELLRLMAHCCWCSSKSKRTVVKARGPVNSETASPHAFSQVRNPPFCTSIDSFPLHATRNWASCSGLGNCKKLVSQGAKCKMPV